MPSQITTLYEAYIQNARQIQFQNDIIALKQAERLKSQTIRQKLQQINEEYERRVQNLRIQKKIKRSSFVNEMRMKVAKTKYQLCEQIFDEVTKRLAKIAEQQDSDYQLIMINLIVEGCVQMFEENLKIKVLQRDLPLVKSLIPDVMKSFKYFMQQEMGQEFDLSLVILENDCLRERGDFSRNMNKNEENEEAIGGVVVTDVTGDVVFKNTLDARLGVLKEVAWPMMRKVLWGKEGELKENNRVQH